jgi:hypothetical protein
MDAILATWVKQSDMHPATNIYGRAWMTKDGLHSGTYYGPETIPKSANWNDILWSFPPKQKSPAN